MADALTAVFSAWGDTDPKSRAATSGAALDSFYHTDPHSQYFADLDDNGRITRLIGYAGTGDET